jgi:acetyl esterase/lipase
MMSLVRSGVAGAMVAMVIGGAVACRGANDAASNAGSGNLGPFGNPDGCTPVVRSTQTDVAYLVRGEASADAMTRLDVYPPAGPICGRPIVIWVHGGAWSVGDKANQMEHKIPFFNGLGAVLVSVNYRLTVAGNGVQHPDHVEDVAAALTWVREHAVELGGAPNRLALLGHSAGAHLVALAVTNPRFLASRGLTAADVACVGSYDSEYTVSEIVARDAQYEAVFTADPKVWADASPSAHVRPGLPPIQLACRGSKSRVAQCEAFGAALSAAGNSATRIDASSLSHEEVNSEIGRPGDAVMTPAVAEFLRSCSAPST